MTSRPTAAELLERHGALLDREHLRELGLDERAIDRLLGVAEVVVLPAVRRVYVPAEQVRAWLEREGVRP